MITLATSDAVANYLKSQIQIWEAEEFWVLALDCKCRLIQARMLFRGTVDHCFSHPRDVFRFALLCNASSLVLGHNHPSGDTEPSKNDLKITKMLIKLGQLHQIPILDHVIVAKSERVYFSYLHHIKK